MKNILNRLSISFNDVNISNNLCDFSLDTESIAFTDTEYLTIEHTTNMHNVFISLTGYNTISSTLICEAYINDSWEAIEILDDTKCFKRDGFITFTQPVLRVRFSVDISLVDDEQENIEFRAINILFADDTDLKREYYPITESAFLLGNSNHYLVHESVRDLIIQKFRNKNVNASESILTPFHLINIQEVRQAAIFYALSKIFNSVSDSDDEWRNKSRAYKTIADEMLEVAFISFNSANTPTSKVLKTKSVGLSR